MKVIFRKFKKEGDIIAFIPAVPANLGLMMSYQHLGQHAEADYKGLINITKPAEPSEYESLANEISKIYSEPVQAVRKMHASMYH